MSIKVQQFPLIGGLNLDLAHSKKPPGFTLYQHNFESQFGNQGYARVAGLQRYDGQRRVQDTSYTVIEIEDEVVSIAVGNMVNAGVAGIEAEVVAREGDVLVVESYADGPEWAVAGPVRVGLVVHATVASVTRGAPSEVRFPDFILPAQAAQRDRITAPGGVVKGIHAWGDTVYAGVDTGGKGIVARTTDSGWVTAIDNLIGGGRHRFIRHNFAGATETLGIFCVDGRNRPWRYNPTDGLQLCAPMVQTNATSTSSVTMGAGDKTFVVVEDARAYTVGQAVTVWANTDRAKWMSGTVLTWDSGTKTLVITITEANGLTDTIADWEIGLSDFSDKPFDLVPYGTRMAYAFPNGQLLLSDVGEPFTFTTTSLSLGTGDEITGIVPVKGGPLAIFCKGSIYLLSGIAVADMRLQLHSADTGAKLFSAIGVGGNAIFLSERGVTSLAASEAFGDFQLGLASSMVNALLLEALPKVAFVKLHRTKMQYRIYLNDGTGIAMTFMQESGILGMGPVAFSTFGYPRTLVCGAGDEQDVSGRELQFVADDDGWVLEEDAGVNFDGEPITAYLHTAFGTYGNDQYKKRFRKMEFEVSAPYSVTFNFRQHFDGLDSYYQPGNVREATTYGGGAVWGAADWNEFVWSGQMVGSAQVNVSGVGRTMGVLVWHESATSSPYTIQTTTVQFSPLGIQR